MTKLFSTFFLSVAIATLPAVAEEAAQQITKHDGASISIPAEKITFGSTGVVSKGLELKAGAGYGNFAVGRHGTFVKMPAGFVSDVHTHTEDYYAVVLKGVATNHAPEGKDLPLPIGSYWFQRGEEPHVTKCLSKTDCLFFLEQPGKFDYVLKKK